MKKTTIFFILLLAFIAGKAQTSIRMLASYDLAYDSIIWAEKVNCNKQINPFLHVYGIAKGYDAITDSILLDLDFGDGFHSMYKTPIYNDSLFSFPFTHYGPHYYTNIGFINLKATVIAPDQKKDSAELNNILIGDVCDTVTGYFYNDADEDCQYDGGETLFNHYVYFRVFCNNIEVSGTNLLETYYPKYTLRLPIDFAYSISAINNANGVFCPSILSVNNIPGTNYNFGYDCNNSYDITGGMFGEGFVPGSTSALITNSIYNFGCVPSTGKIKLVYDTTFLIPLSSNMAYTLSDDTIIWDYSNLESYYTTQAEFSPQINFYVSTFLLCGDLLWFTLIETPLTGDYDPSNNIQHNFMEVNNSYDPNDKQVSPRGNGEDGLIVNNQNMYYLVRFQNTGNAYARNVYIIDTLDNDLDIGTFSVLETSHPMNLEFLTPHVLKFNFPNINLPDSGSNQEASNGYVRYSIRQKPDLISGTKITNTAYIYFDYNPAVITNTTINTIDIETAIVENKIENEILVYPNPSAGIFNIVSDKNGIVEVMNMCGQVILSNQINNQGLITLNLGDQPRGLYFIRLCFDNNVIVKKVLID